MLRRSPLRTARPESTAVAIALAVTWPSPQLQPEQLVLRDRPANCREHAQHAHRVRRQRVEPSVDDLGQRVRQPQAFELPLGGNQLADDQWIAARALHDRGTKAERRRAADELFDQREDLVARQQPNRQSLDCRVLAQVAQEIPGWVLPLDLIGVVAQQ